jgi:hypothetical protein
VAGTGLVLPEQVTHLLHLRLLLLLCYLPRLCLHLRLLGVWVVVVAVDGMVVNWRSQGPGIANMGCLYVAVRQEGLRGLSPMLGECFLQCLHLHSSCVPLRG